MDKGTPSTKSLVPKGLRWTEESYERSKSVILKDIGFLEKLWVLEKKGQRLQMSTAPLLATYNSFLQINDIIKDIYDRFENLDADVKEFTRILRLIRKWMKTYQPVLDEAAKDYADKAGRITKLDKRH